MNQSAQSHSPVESAAREWGPQILATYGEGVACDRCVTVCVPNAKYCHMCCLPRGLGLRHVFSSDVYEIVCSFLDAKTLCSLERTCTKMQQRMALDRYSHTWQTLRSIYGGVSSHQLGLNYSCKAFIREFVWTMPVSTSTLPVVRQPFRSSNSRFLSTFAQNGFGAVTCWFRSCSQQSPHAGLVSHITHGHLSASGFDIGLPSSTQVRLNVSQFTSFYNMAIVHVPWCDGEWHFVAALMCDEYVQLFVDDQQSERVRVSHERGRQQQERFGRIGNTLDTR
jgi:hypothetical protein